MLTKSHNFLFQILFLVVVFIFLVISSPVQPPGSIFTNETSIMMPDNETIIEMKISVKNQDNSALRPVSSILQSPAVMDQIIGAVGKAIEVEDKKEGAAIRDSIRTAFIKMSGGEQSVSHAKEEEKKPEGTERKEKEEVKQQAKVKVHLDGNKDMLP
eukprot:TRINITY_DN6950_c0_g1_i2.p1 TRINITY_DN6950_c0_g1~~TRINITY_DN6950_c0_g1_i2.p1  ORF type:complete len:157 (-),score=45.82 TRINITY_DN6950_c0_g1_i2:62-532(-)